MGFFGNQLSNVVEWQEYRDDIIFWKWCNDEIKKGSRLIIRPGQDAIFMYNGKTEGVFRDEGSFDIESDIIPFLSSLKGFKFGFNSGIRAEVLFINTKEFTIKWGTKNAIHIPAPQLNLPGGLPIRSFGTFSCKVSDYQALIDKVAGIKQQYTVEDIKERVLAVLDQLLMKWIAKEGRDMFNLQANAYDISKGIKEDLDMELCKIGIAITEFNISSFSYPEEVQKMQNRAASQSMVGDMGRYQQMSMMDSMARNGSGGNMATNMAGMQMGMMMGQQMANQMAANMNGMQQGNQTQQGNQMQQGNQTQQGNQMQQSNQTQQGSGMAPRFCPNCGTPTNGANFCGNCGQRLV